MGPLNPIPSFDVPVVILCVLVSETLEKVGNTIYFSSVSLIYLICINSGIVVPKKNFFRNRMVFHHKLNPVLFVFSFICIGQSI